MWVERWWVERSAVRPHNGRMPFSIRPALAALMAASLAMGCKEPPPQPTEAALALTGLLHP